MPRNIDRRVEGALPGDRPLHKKSASYNDPCNRTRGQPAAAADVRGRVVRPQAPEERRKPGRFPGMVPCTPGDPGTMPAPDPIVPVPGACAFAASRLLPLLDTFFLEIGHVRNSDDTEAVHRLRVASRRLRAALPLFPLCFPEKDLRLWIREVKECTRALGPARDTDVRIVFLKKYLKGRHQTPRENQSESTIPERTGMDPLVRLQKKLRRERKTQQEKLVGVLDKIEQGGGLATSPGILPRAGRSKDPGKKELHFRCPPGCSGPDRCAADIAAAVRAVHPFPGRSPRTPRPPDSNKKTPVHDRDLRTALPEGDGKADRAAQTAPGPARWDP